MNNNDMLFMGILKSANMDQNMRKELLDLHSRQSELGAKIKMKKNMEYKYNQLKIEELNERIDEMKFQSKFFIKRNNKILEEINKNEISSFELASNSNQTLENLIKSKKNYQNYLNSLMPKILNQFNEQILQNNLLSKELNNIRENEKKGNFYKQLIDYNDNMMKEIDILKKKNDLLISQNKEKEKILLEKEQQKLNLLVESGVNKEEILKSQNDGSYLNLMPNKPLLKQYVLNMNHNYGKLDKLKGEQLDAINKQLENEYNQRNNNAKDLLNDSQNSLDDLRNQILPPSKFYNPEFGGTLNQNFDVSNINRSSFRLFNSKIEDNSKKEKDNEPKPVPVIRESQGSNLEYNDYNVSVVENKNKNEEEIKYEEEIKNEEENKNQKNLEVIKESQKGEIDDNVSEHKKDNEEKKEEEIKETKDGEDKKEQENEEIDDGNGSNHDYDDCEVSEV